MGRTNIKSHNFFLNFCTLNLFKTINKMPLGVESPDVRRSPRLRNRRLDYKALEIQGKNIEENGNRRSPLASRKKDASKKKTNRARSVSPPPRESPKNTRKAKKSPSSSRSKKTASKDTGYDEGRLVDEIREFNNTGSMLGTVMRGVSVACVVLSVAVFFAAVPKLDGKEIDLMFNFDGTPNGFKGTKEHLLAFPVMSVIIFMVLDHLINQNNFSAHTIELLKSLQFVETGILATVLVQIVRIPLQGLTGIG